MYEVEMEVNVVLIMDIMDDVMRRLSKRAVMKENKLRPMCLHRED